MKLEILALALDKSACGVVITDAKKKDNPIVFVNAEFCKMTGYLPHEVISKNCRFLQGANYSQPGLAALRNSMKCGKTCTVTLQNYKKNGDLFWNELTISPVKNKSDEITHFIGIQKDVTASVQIHEQRESFVATLIHDLKNPLVGASRLLDYMLSSRTESDEDFQLLSLMKSTNNDLLGMISNALTCYRENDGKLEPQIATIKLYDLLQGIIEILRPLAEAKGVKLNMQCPQICIEADELLYKRVLINLVENAIKHSYIDSTVIVSTRFSNEAIAVDVSNKGQILCAETINKLNQKFYTSDKSVGNGLGLFVANLILKKHGGKLLFSRRAQEWNTFSAVLPLPA